MQSQTDYWKDTWKKDYSCLPARSLLCLKVAADMKSSGIKHFSKPYQYDTSEDSSQQCALTHCQLTLALLAASPCVWILITMGNSSVRPPRPHYFNRFAVDYHSIHSLFLI